MLETFPIPIHPCGLLKDLTGCQLTFFFLLLLFVEYIIVPKIRIAKQPVNVS
jgi:hypothetical protein